MAVLHTRSVPPEAREGGEHGGTAPESGHASPRPPRTHHATAQAFRALQTRLAQPFRARPTTSARPAQGQPAESAAGVAGVRTPMSSFFGDTERAPRGDVPPPQESDPACAVNFPDLTGRRRCRQKDDIGGAHPRHPWSRIEVSCGGGVEWRAWWWGPPCPHLGSRPRGSGEGSHSPKDLSDADRPSPWGGPSGFKPMRVPD